VRFDVPFAATLLWLNVVSAFAGYTAAALCGVSILMTVGASILDDRHKRVVNQGANR